MRTACVRLQGGVAYSFVHMKQIHIGYKNSFLDIVVPGIVNFQLGICSMIGTLTGEGDRAVVKNTIAIFTYKH